MPCKRWYINGTKVKISKSSFKDYPMWERATSIYYTLLNADDDSMGYKFHQLIEKRNNFIHADSRLSSVSSDIATAESNRELYDIVEELIKHIIAYRVF